MTASSDDLETLALCCEPYTWLAESAALAFRALEQHGVAPHDVVHTVVQLCIEHAQQRSDDLRASACRSGSCWEREECLTWSGVVRRLTDYRDRLPTDQAA